MMRKFNKASSVMVCLTQTLGASNTLLDSGGVAGRYDGVNKTVDTATLTVVHRVRHVSNTVSAAD